MIQMQTGYDDGHDSSSALKGGNHNIYLHAPPPFTKRASISAASISMFLDIDNHDLLCRKLVQEAGPC